MGIAEALRETIALIQIVSYPFLIGGAAVGFLIALIQTLTQVQEQTLPQVVKIILAFIIALASFDAIGDVTSTLTITIFDMIIQI